MRGFPFIMFLKTLFEILCKADIEMFWISHGLKNVDVIEFLHKMYPFPLVAMVYQVVE